MNYRNNVSNKYVIQRGENVGECLLTILQGFCIYLKDPSSKVTLAC